MPNPPPPAGIEIGALALPNFLAPLPPFFKAGLDFLPFLPSPGLDFLPFLPKAGLDFLPFVPNAGLDFLPNLPKAGLDFLPFLPKAGLKGLAFLPNLKGFLALGFLNARGKGNGFLGVLLAKSCLASSLLIWEGAIQLKKSLKMIILLEIPYNKKVEINA